MEQIFTSRLALWGWLLVTAGAQPAFAEEAAQGAAPQRLVDVNEYFVRGNTVLDARAIEEAVYPFLGPQKALSDIEGARDALQKAYQARGYQSVFVELPEQELLARDKINLDLFWLKDANAEDPDSLPPPDEIAEEIVENLELALSRFRKVAAELAKLRTGTG